MGEVVVGNLFSFAFMVPMTMDWTWVAESEGNGVGLPELIFHAYACWKAGKTYVTAYMRFKEMHAGLQSFWFKFVP